MNRCQKRFSKHATERAAERGFSEPVVQFVLKHADVWKPARDGRQALFVSPAYAEVLGFLGVPAPLLARVRRCCVIVSEHTRVVVTVHDGARLDRVFH